MFILRRTLIKQLISLSTLCLLLPKVVLAWPKQAFLAHQLTDALNHLFGQSHLQESNQITIKVDKLVESGDEVAIRVETDHQQVESITLFVEKNIPPMAITVNFPSDSLPFLHTRLKFSQSSDVIAVIKNPDGLFSHREYVRVLVGSCI